MSLLMQFCYSLPLKNSKFHCTITIWKKKFKTETKKESGLKTPYKLFQHVTYFDLNSCSIKPGIRKVYSIRFLIMFFLDALEKVFVFLEKCYFSQIGDFSFTRKQSFGDTLLHKQVSYAQFSVHIRYGSRKSLLFKNFWTFFEIFWLFLKSNERSEVLSVRLHKRVCPIFYTKGLRPRILEMSTLFSCCFWNLLISAPILRLLIQSKCHVVGFFVA